VSVQARGIVEEKRAPVGGGDLSRALSKHPLLRLDRSSREMVTLPAVGRSHEEAGRSDETRRVPGVIPGQGCSGIERRAGRRGEDRTGSVRVGEIPANPHHRGQLRSAQAIFAPPGA
jgi:hypothetical protein